MNLTEIKNEFIVYSFCHNLVYHPFIQNILIFVKPSFNFFKVYIYPINATQYLGTAFFQTQ